MRRRYKEGGNGGMKIKNGRNDIEERRKALGNESVGKE